MVDCTCVRCRTPEQKNATLSRELRTLADEFLHGSMHWQGCHTLHARCALIKAAERIELLERSIKAITNGTGVLNGSPRSL